MTVLMVREAARRLGVHENTVRAMMADGRLEYVRLSHPRAYRRVTAASVESFLHEQRRRRAGIRQCEGCGRLTTLREAGQRRFNPGRCACGGELR